MMNTNSCRMPSQTDNERLSSPHLDFLEIAMAFPCFDFELVLKSIVWFVILLRGDISKKRANDAIVHAVAWWRGTQ